MAEFFRDISLDFGTINPITGDIGSLDGVLAVRNSVINLILTNKNEIHFGRHKGTNIEGLQFESNSVLSQIEAETYIKEVLSYYEPRVNLQKVQTSRDGNTLYVQVIYEITTMNKVDSITITVSEAK